MPAEDCCRNEKIFFTAYNQWRDNTWSFADLWVSDGTEEGTQLVKISGRHGTTTVVAKSSIMWNR